ncbi:MAG: heavy metal translocating P-type ATPase [Ruminococcus callidus]|nr:heavy metal translocating P-type ATPase [Ruminococcus callidus]
MKHFNVTGMSCAACSARVEKAVKNTKGVTECSVNLLTNSMNVEGTATDEEIINAVVKAGYGASNADSADNKSKKTNSDDTQKKQTKALRNRLLISLGFLIVLMYISMGHMMWGFPLPHFFDGNHVAMGIVQMLLAIIIMVINKKFFVSGFKGLIHKAPNMDTLVALGSGASFIYSLVILFAMTDAQVKNNADAVMKYMHDFYFESAAMILVLITFGKMLESYSKGKTTDALNSLKDLAPETAVVIRNGKEIQISVEELTKDDIFVLKPGDRVPADGIIIEGRSSIDESVLTGESVPCDKKEGDKVSAATINKEGYLKCRAEKVGSETALAGIIRMVSDASATKAPVAKAADKVSGIFVPAVIIIAFITTVIWLIAGEDFGFALSRGISVLVISCPCALGLATPVAIMVGNGIAAKNGILFKTAASLEQAGKIQIAALDKTGTITKGEPEVTDVVTFENISNENFISIAASLESKSEHPLANAVVKYAEKSNINLYETKDFKSHTGKGAEGIVNEKTVHTGNVKYISEFCEIKSEISGKIKELSSQGKTPLIFESNGKIIGIIAVADTIREDSREAIKAFKNLGIRTVMLTGDNAETAKYIAELAGVDEVAAGLLPEDKEKVIRELKKHGKTAMIGDGINDAPALTRADTAIAIGAGTDIAIDSADIVLMKNSLLDAVSAVRLSRQTLKNIHENLFWAFIYNVLGIPLAAGVWIPLFGLKLSPMFGAAAMSLSSFCVVSNALRLNLFNIKSNKKDRKVKNQIDFNCLPERREEVGKMKKTMFIKGMMCGHCEATVKKTLEAIDGVASAEVSHEKGTAIVTLSSDVDNSVLKKAVEDKDYTVEKID